MKRILLFFALLLSAASTFAQTIITATGYPVNPTYVATHVFGRSCTPPCTFQPVATMFVVTNTNSYPITVQDVGYSTYATVRHELWYSFSSVTGVPTPIASPDWTWVGVVPSTGVTFATIVNNFFSQVNVIIPANTSCRFAVVGYENVLMGASILPTPTITTNGVTMDVSASACYWGLQTNPNLPGFGYYGSITFRNPVCNVVPPASINVSNVKSTTATVGWTAVPSATSYEYVIDQNPIYFSGTPISVATNTLNLTGLTPSTNYTIHLRSRCAADNASEWKHFSITTLPPCSEPSGLNITNLTDVSARINWTGTSTAQDYEYVVDQSNTDPTGSTGVSTTTNTYADITPLVEGTWYYVHVRTICSGEESAWILDSFKTPIPCRIPVLNVSYINTDEAVVYWDKINTAVKYEYALTSSPATPPSGTIIPNTSVLASTLRDGKDYYMHVRSHCQSEGAKLESSWANIHFRTFPVNVNDVDANFRFAAYPNPVKNILHITLDANSKNGELSITDVTGKLIQRIDIEQKEMQLSMSDLSAGIYLLKYKDDTHDRTIKVVKQ
jgi:hypothetical protein